jgi:hypothetical protein
MAITFSEMKAAIEEAKAIQRRSDMVAGDMARFISGRLKISDVPHYILCELKRELERYNMHTGTWKD